MFKYILIAIAMFFTQIKKTEILANKLDYPKTYMAL